MVHHTMNTSSSKAPSASSKSKVMSALSAQGRRAQQLLGAAALLALWSCASVQVGPPLPVPAAAEPAPSSTPLQRAKSRWVPVRWSELPGLEEDALPDAWKAWVRSCVRPGTTWAPLCADVRRLSTASAPEQRAWMVARLQPYRVEALDSSANGLLTSYFEPVLAARRQSGAGYQVPLYRTPATLSSRKPWYTRQEIETLPEAQAAVRGREIAWLENPVDAMLLHIQGSGRLSVTEPDGSRKTVRVAFAGSNEQPYGSNWLQAPGFGKLTPWPDATRAWAAQNPQRAPQLLWGNPRYIFFKEEALTEADADAGPRGAQGVPLTAGRSIAVDPGSIPYGTPVWLASQGAGAQLQKLVLAQDTGSAIVGAVRADYFAGTGPEAGQLASRVNQPLRLWVLWPK